MRACGAIVKPAIFRNVTRETRKLRNGCLVVAPATMPALWLNRIPLETGTAAPRVSVEGNLFSKKQPPRSADSQPRFINMDRGPITPTGAHI